MLQRGTRGRSTRRSLARIALGSAALVGAMFTFSGCINDVPHISETCTQPASMADGFLANRTISYRVSTQTSPTDPKTTWICENVHVGDVASDVTARRISIRADAGATVGQVTTDSNSRACASGSNNSVPSPHPIEQGGVGDLSFYLDAYANGTNAAWLCLEAGSVKQRVIVNTPTATTPTVVVNDDPTPSPLQDTTPPPVGKPSSSCYAGAYGPADELINTHTDTRDLFLYTARPSDNELHVCARLSGPQSGGVHLAVNAAADQIVRIEPSPDTTPCTQNVVTLSNPPASIKTTPPGQSPPSVCVDDTRYTVIVGPIPPVVDWDLDN
jgi:hypothetical protein